MAEAEANDVFVLNPKHIDFVEGRQVRLKPETTTFVASLLIGALLLIPVLCSISTEPVNPSALLFFAVPALLIIGLTLLARWRELQFLAQAQLLEGKIIASEGQYVTRRKHWVTDWWIDIKYEFVSPDDKQVIHRKTHFLRNDLRDRIPEIGSRVTILYLNKRRFMAL